MFEEIVGASPALKAVLERVVKVAPTDSGVFITGETGTGNELIARAIHKRSQRSSRPFVSVGCAAIPVALIASETFSVDASWLVRESRQTQPASQPLSEALVTHEKEIIEAALTESRGRVSGPTGAAAKLGIPPTTLESKIKSLNINKHRFKLT
jgi:transcriptional regulator with GAF, ATPase, and Fis domain